MTMKLYFKKFLVMEDEMTAMVSAMNSLPKDQAMEIYPKWLALAKEHVRMLIDQMELLEQLDPDVSRIIRMRYHFGLQWEEIAARMEKTKSTVITMHGKGMREMARIKGWSR